MTAEFDAALAQDVSSNTGPGEGQSPDNIPQSILDFATQFVTDEPQNVLEEVQEEASVDSVEEEQESTEDVENIEEYDEAEEEEQLSEDAPVYTFDDLKDGVILMKVGGEEREMSLSQIASELGQVKAASKAQSEVKTQLEDLEARKEALQEEHDLLKRQQEVAVESQQLGAKAAEIQRYQNAYNLAAQNGDTNAMVQLKYQLEVLHQDYAQTQHHVEQVQQEATDRLLQEQSKKLEELGYGSLLTDQQRRNSLATYVSDKLSASAAQAVNYDASLLAVVEKARLYDAAQAKRAKPKASGKKTMKAGSGKVNPAAKKESGDPFLDVAKRLLGQQ